LIKKDEGGRFFVIKKANDQKNSSILKFDQDVISIDEDSKMKSLLQKELLY
jgi:hypothetical protein